MGLDLIGAIASGAAFGLFGLYVSGWVVAWFDHKRRERRRRKALENQTKAFENACDLILYDQEMTRSHLVSQWEKI